MSRPGYAIFNVAGANYLYDSHTNGVVEIDPHVRRILDDYFRLSRKELENAHPALSKASLKRSIEFIEEAIGHGDLLQPLPDITYSSALNPDEFRTALWNDLSELTLNVTDHCNQFCSYCILTSSRLSQPEKALPSMTWDIARNSLDCFLTVTSAQRPVNIGFYGGEPLVNWELIAKCLRYLRESYAGRTIRVRLVTNATLLKKNILKTLIDHDVDLQVSFDGPQHIHDSARFFAGGEGTHQQVCDRLAEIRALNPDYFRNHVFLNCTFNKQNDILELFRYFSGDMFAELPTTLGYVRNHSPDRFPVPAELAARHEKRVEQLIELYLAALRDNSRFHYDLFWEILKDPLLLASRSLGLAPGLSWPNQTCVPGVRRLFVTSTGWFYPCERFCPQGWDIGSHGTGIEFPKAHALFRTYADHCQQMCQGCWAYRLCSLCYLGIVSDGQVKTSVKAKRCDRERDRIVRGLRRFVYIWKNEPPESHNHPFSLHFQVRSQDGG